MSHSSSRFQDSVIRLLQCSEMNKSQSRTQAYKMLSYKVNKLNVHFYVHAFCTKHFTTSDSLEHFNTWSCRFTQLFWQLTDLFIFGRLHDKQPTVHSSDTADSPCLLGNVPQPQRPGIRPDLKTASRAAFLLLHHLPPPPPPPFPSSSPLPPTLSFCWLLS